MPVPAAKSMLKFSCLLWNTEIRRDGEIGRGISHDPEKKDSVTAFLRFISVRLRDVYRMRRGECGGDQSCRYGLL